jgi:hypothetical protein
MKKIWSTILILMALLPALTAAESPVQRHLPLLNNHYFMPFANFPSPFITTIFKTGIGGGVSTNQIPVYWVDGRLIGQLEGKNTFVNATVLVKVRAKEWLATWFKYEANARIGSNTSTLLTHGVTSITGFEFGWMYRLWQNPNNLLSLTLQIDNTTVSTMNLLRFLNDVITSPDSITATLSQKRNPLSGGLGFRYAHAFNDLWGVEAYLYGSYGESFLQNDNNVWQFNMGILGSANFNHRYGIPVGGMLGFTVKRLTLFQNQEDDQTESILAKIAYVGREEYNMGLEFYHVRTATPLLSRDSSMRYLTVSFVVTYIF